MYQVVALVAFISLSILSQSNLSWSLAIPNGVNEQDVENLFQNDVQQTANDNVITITSEKTLVEKESEYSCFPWIFNPGCPLNKLIDWKWVCRTNTLGWEQCDVLENIKRKRQNLEFAGDDQIPKKF